MHSLNSLLRKFFRCTDSAGWVSGRAFGL